MTEKTYRFPAHFGRFCDVHECYQDCPLRKDKKCAIACDPDKAEKIIMAWVAENPEPKPITWAEWWRGMFPKAISIPCPNSFGCVRDCRTRCDDCREENFVPDWLLKMFEDVSRPAKASEEKS